MTHRPNFAVTPRSPPTGEYIAAVERNCHNMDQGEADEMRAEVKAVMKKIQPPRHNITREEQKALRGVEGGQLQGSPYCRQGCMYGGC